jgi:DNA-binding beta-propeller fold protein YncE
MLIKKLVLASLVMFGMAGTAPAQISLTPVGTVRTGLFRDADPRMAEINAYDAAGKRIYVVNPADGVLDVIDATNPSIPVDVGSVFIANVCQAAMGTACPVLPGSEPNSVAIHGNLMAVAVANAVRTDNGHAVFFELQGVNAPRFLAALEVGALPDMITFSEDGKYALTANEGEPNPTYTIDPPGTVSIIEIARIGTSNAVRHVDFERFDNPGQRARLESEGVRIFGPGATLSQDLEPEYIAVRNNKAYVTLQENNALAILNVSSATVEKIVGLGLKDHSVDINELDASDQDGGINIRTWPIYGLYQPDSIHAFTVHGRTYLLTANEGDAREYAAYVEAVRVNNASYLLDPLIFPQANLLKANTVLGRLNVSKASGDVNGDGFYDRIETFGARSFSIRDQQGKLVWDSGDMLERLSEKNDALAVNLFNTTNSANSRDNRSDDKGIEPESIVVGEVGGTLYAFVGLERDSGIVVFDLSNPEAPAYVTYALNRKFPRNPSTGNLLACNNVNDCGDLGPEGLTFVPAVQSPTGSALLIVSNEVSSTTTIWEVK